MQKNDFQEINSKLKQEKIMEQDVTFSYKYSAKENKEVQVLEDF